MSEPTVTCRDCGRSILVVLNRHGFPPDTAKRTLAKECKERGCPASGTIYRAWIETAHA